MSFQTAKSLIGFDLYKILSVFRLHRLLVIFKILWDVTIYRLSRFEMANLVSAFFIMLAIQLTAVDITVRLFFGFLLNLLIYLNNDYCDIKIDLNSGKKDKTRTIFLHEHRLEALLSQIFLVALLSTIALLYDFGLFFVFLASASICWLYSSKMKNIAFVDIGLMIIAVTLLSMIAAPLDNLLGWCLAFQLGLIAGAFQSIQVMRDIDDDRHSNVQTTAVVIGFKNTKRIFNALILISSIFAAITLNYWVAGLLSLAVFIPCKHDNMSQFWNQVRLITSAVWLCILTGIYLHQTSNGLIWSIHKNQAIEIMSFFNHWIL